MKNWHTIKALSHKAFGSIGLATVFFCVAILSLSEFNAASAAANDCTNLPAFNPPQGGAGLVSTIIIQVQIILNTVAASMYNGIIATGSFQTLVKTGATLYIAIYGIMFTVGIVQATVADVTIRGVKLSIVAILISPGSWGFFSSTVMTFFNQGTDELINAVTAIAVGGIAVPGGAPFSVLDGAMSKALSAKMIATVLAVFTTGPNGIIIGLLLLACLGSFIRTVFKAMLVYFMSLVMKTLLFGIAPIFIACVLFTRTKSLFNGWLNQIVNACLQPILLFAFFAFFVKLIESNIDLVTVTPVCWTQLADGFRGSQFGQHFWRFQVDQGAGLAPFRGLWSFIGPQVNGGGANPIFPIDILVVITFLLLADLSTRFNDIVLEVAKDLAGAVTNLSALAGSMNDWFNKTVGQGEGSSGGEGGRGRPAPGASGGPARGPGLGGVLGDGGRSSRNFIEQITGNIARRPGVGAPPPGPRPPAPPRP